MDAFLRILHEKFGFSIVENPRVLFSITFGAEIKIPQKIPRVAHGLPVRIPCETRTKPAGFHRATTEETRGLPADFPRTARGLPVG